MTKLQCALILPHCASILLLSCRSSTASTLIRQHMARGQEGSYRQRRFGCQTSRKAQHLPHPARPIVLAKKPNGLQVANGRCAHYDHICCLATAASEGLDLVIVQPQCVKQLSASLFDALVCVYVLVANRMSDLSALLTRDGLL